MTTLLDTALSYHAAGLVVLPNDAAAKYPAGLRGWQTVTPTEADVRKWFANGSHAIGIRDVEGADFDNKGSPGAQELLAAWTALVEQLAPGLVERLPLEQTPSGGFHVPWRCAVIEGNQKLATRPPTPAELGRDPKLTSVTLIETRGKGGQFQVAPSPGYTMIRGSWTSLPEISVAERQILLDAARALSQTDNRIITRMELQTKGNRAGDVYNATRQDDAQRLLEAAGWLVVAERGNTQYLRRPGKTEGVSATLGHVAPGVLYVFSSNASPFQPNAAYSPFAIYTELEHSGDYKEAAKALYEEAEAKGVDPKTGEIREQAEKAAPKASDWRSTGVTLAALQFKQFEPEKWIVESLMPEGACLVAAKYKSRKSWLALAVSLAVSMNRPALGRLPVSPGRVLYLDLEGKQQRIQKRTRSILGVHRQPWPDNFHIFTKWPMGDEAYNELEYWFQSYPDTALVVVDVLASFRRPMAKHEEIYRYDRDTVDPINALCERYHAGGMLIHHFNKSRTDDIMDSITGSTGLPSAVNTMWGLERDPSDSAIWVLHRRGRDLENEDPIALRWDSESNTHIIEGNAGEVSISAERRRVLDAMRDDAVWTPRGLAVQLKTTVGSIQMMLSQLLTAGQVDKVGYGKYQIIATGEAPAREEPQANDDDAF